MPFRPIAMPTQEQALFTQENLQEVLTTERLLLKHSQLPGVFFHFPGVVADLLRLGTLGLISPGADAWLAKGEQPRPGSIVLVHGNGNEVPGIQKVIKLLDDKSLLGLPFSH